MFEGGGNRPAEDRGAAWGAGRPCAAAVTCHAWHRGRVSGRRARKTPPTGNCGHWGLGELNGCGDGIFSPGFITESKI